MEGQFRVLRMLGAGGCGKTYEVSDRDRTLKVLKILSNNDPKYVELFQREALLLSHLKHPGIPSVERNAYFTTHPKNSSDPLHCLVMEKIIGLDLHKYLRQRGQPIAERLAWHWLYQLADILKTIHYQNILHRDIKPSNIMLKADGNLALVDFGTARSITNIYESETPVPATRIMSALYTPDEQMKGHPVTQSDFFALGRTFIFLLTAKDLGEFYDPLNAEFDWSNSTDSISPEFVSLVNALTAPLPIDRPSSAADILEQLKAIKTAVFREESGDIRLAYAQTQLQVRPNSPSEDLSPRGTPPPNPLEPQPSITGNPSSGGPSLNPPSVPGPGSGVVSNPPSGPVSGGFLNPPSGPVSAARPADNAYQPQQVSQAFVEQCQMKLAESIGPIAKIICQQTLNQRQNWTRSEFVEALAAKIQSPAAMDAFKRSLLY